MSRRLVLLILGLIILLNVFVIGYVLISREIDNNKEDEVAQDAEDAEDAEDSQDAQDPEDSQNSDNEVQQPEEESTDQTTEEQTEAEGGNVPSDGNYDENEAALNKNAIEKSSANQNLMIELGRWIATNYEPKDIQTKTYTVQRGDTLWEISEAYYGTGFDWHKILELNRSDIGYLPNGSQALIIPGQILILE
ncbi:LysM peptidoglycan-binding domain-containing protein [Candidatus Dojkabacteria bacterium]|nr:LysM peptidoglycan-binding domain-containing protein [Candidatus Dojkabacteria bacterium]